MDSLQGKVVIVTGASEGVGAGLAAALRKRGALLTLVARSEEKLKAVAGPDDLIVACDLTQDACRVAVVEKTIERRGRLDILINNAGRGSYYKATASPVDDSRSMFDLNFFAPLHLGELAAPWLIRAKGTLVNVSSIAGLVSLPWLPVYSASKFALSSLTETQRMELRRHGVNVMGVYPGYVDTNFQAHATGGSVPASIVSARRFCITTAECAETIIQGIEKRRKVVITPWVGWVLVWLNRLVPGLVAARLEAM